MANLDVSLRLRLLNELSGPAKSAQRDLKGIADAAKGLATVKGGENLARDLGRVSTEAGRAAGGVRRLGSARAGLAGLQAVSAALGREVGQVAAATARADAGFRRMRDARSHLAATGEAARALARDIDRLKPQRAPAASGRAAVEKEGGGGVLTGAALAARGLLPAVGAAYAARAAIRGTVGEAVSFEKAWAEVQKKVNDAPTKAAMTGLERSVTRTAIELGLSRQGMAELTAEAGAAGIKFQDLERYGRLVAKASIGWDMQPREASDRLAKIKAGSQMSIGEVEELADKINALGDSSAAKENELVEMFQRSGDAAKAAGVDTNTTLAALTALRSAGLQEEIGARFFSAFTGKLATAGAGGRGTKDMAEGFRQLGLTTKEVAEGMKTDAAGTIITILERLQKTAEPAKAALKIAGGEWWDELTRFNPEAFKKHLAFVRDPSNWQGSLKNNLDVQLNTTANHLERLKALTGDIGDRLGRWALPPINAAIESTVAGVDEFKARQRVAEASGRRDGVDRAVAGVLDPVKRALGLDNVPVGAMREAVLTKVLGALPTTDPARAAAGRQLAEADDLRALAERARKDGGILAERAGNAKGADRTRLAAAAQRARIDADEREARARSLTTSAGRFAARDMTDVEVGEAAAQRSIREKRRLEAEAVAPGDARSREITALRELLGGGTGSVLRDDRSGRFFARGVIEERLRGLEAVQSFNAERFDMRRAGPTSDLRGRFGLGGIDGPKPDTGIAPRLDGAGADAARQIRAELSQDFSGPGQESASTFAAALKGGLDKASADVAAAVARMKGELSFTATPTIAPRVIAPTGAEGGGAGGVTRAAVAPRRQGGGSGMNIAAVHVHGVRDVAALHHEIQREADYRARGARDGALHDIGSYA